MSETNRNLATDSGSPDPRWKDLYQIGAVSSLLVAVLVLCAIVAYFIWPFKPGFTSTENIFTTLQADRLGGLMSLDLPFPVIVLINILPLLALYAALKKVNESYALIALVFGLVSVVALIPSRPIAELVLLSDQYASATTETERIQYLAAGESLHALFNGTAWMVYSILVGISTLTISGLMLRSPFFGKRTAYVGIACGIAGPCVLIPAIGTFMSLLATFGGMIWSLLLARALFRLGWGESKAAT
jgi:hypothetical protein